MGFIRYKQKIANVLKLEKYLKYVDTKQHLERNDKLQNKKNK